LANLNLGHSHFTAAIAVAKLRRLNSIGHTQKQAIRVQLALKLVAELHNPEESHLHVLFLITSSSDSDSFLNFKDKYKQMGMTTKVSWTNCAGWLHSEFKVYHHFWFSS
jgi:hypothetical protein